MNVSITMVRALIAAVERLGVGRERLLAESGLDPQRLEDFNAQLSWPEFSRVQRAAVELSGDAALGLHIVEQASAAEYEVFGHLAAHAGTLRQCIDTVARYARIVASGPSAELHEDGATASVRYAFPSHGSRSVRFGAELALSGTLRILRLFAGADARPRGVYFAYEAPVYRAEYTRVFGGTEHFGHGFTGIEFDRAWLETTQLHKNAELYAVLETQAERALGRLERDTTIAELVKQQLAARDPLQMPTMDDVARELGMSARSLRRRLLAEGAAYKDLVEHVLMRTAKRMLEDRNTSIQEAAHALGFAAPAAFHRAFKRWTGMTPKEYKASF